MNKKGAVSSYVRSHPLLSAAVIFMAALSLVGFILCAFTKIGESYYFIGSKTLDLNSAGLSSTKGIDRMGRLELLDLRGNSIPNDEILELSELLPECDMLFDITINGRTYDNTVSEIVFSSVTQSDLNLLSQFRDLTTIDARGLSTADVDRITAARPDCNVIWDVSIGGQRYPLDTTELVIGAATAEEVRSLVYFDQLQSVDAHGCTEYDALLEVSTQMSDCVFSWSVSIGGMELESSTEIIDFKRQKVTDIDALSQDFAKLKYLPNLKQVDMCGCKVPNEQMAQWRDTYPEYKFVWEITFGTSGRNWTVRTDIEVFSTLLGAGSRFGDENMYRDLFLYCTDLKALDLGHNVINDISLMSNLKKLQAIILTDNPVSDMTALGTLPELMFVELDMTGVYDVSPFANNKKLVHLDVHHSKVLDISPLQGCTSIRALICCSNGIRYRDIQALQETLPDCEIVYAPFITQRDRDVYENEIRTGLKKAFKNWDRIDQFTDYKNFTFKD